MPLYDNDLALYDQNGWLYRRPQWMLDEADAKGIEMTAYTDSETTFLPDWRVDNDPRLVADYAADTLTLTYSDRNNDEYLPDVTGFTMPNDAPTLDVLFGYNLSHFTTDKQVTCWYCKPGNVTFSYREFSALCPQAYDEERKQRAFCYAMLEHFQQHRDSNDLPYIRYKGRDLVTASGKVVPRPDFYGRPPVAMQGPSAKWFDPTNRVGATNLVGAYPITE